MLSGDLCECLKMFCLGAPGLKVLSLDRMEGGRRREGGREGKGGKGGGGRGVDRHW